MAECKKKIVGIWVYFWVLTQNVCLHDISHYYLGPILLAVKCALIGKTKCCTSVIHSAEHGCILRGIHFIKHIDSSWQYRIA